MEAGSVGHKWLKGPTHGLGDPREGSALLTGLSHQALSLQGREGEQYPLSGGQGLGQGRGLWHPGWIPGPHCQHWHCGHSLPQVRGQSMGTLSRNTALPPAALHPCHTAQPQASMGSSWLPSRLVFLCLLLVHSGYRQLPVYPDSAAGFWCWARRLRRIPWTAPPTPPPGPQAPRQTVRRYRLCVQSRFNPARATDYSWSWRAVCRKELGRTKV